MPGDRPLAHELLRRTPQHLRNPHILNFCRVLVANKGDRHGPESLKKLLHDMYRLFENMLGQNMVKALPEDVRARYLALTEDLSSLKYEQIGEIFDAHVPDHEAVMKRTMREFAEIFMRNRTFNPADYPVAKDAAAGEDDEDDEPGQAPR